MNAGNVNGKNWIPAECDVSIRPGWFYHKAEDSKVKTPEQLFNLYLKSVGRGANLLLNVPPDGRGLINENDSAPLVNFKKLVKENLTDNFIRHAGVSVISGDSIRSKNVFNDKNAIAIAEIRDHKNEFIQVHFKKPTKINCVVLKELIQEGQSVQKFYIQVRNKKQLESYMFSTVGRKRIITFPAMEADDLMIHFPEGRRKIKITSVEACLIDERLIEK